MKTADDILNEVLETIEPQYQPGPMQLYIARLCIEIGIKEGKEQVITQLEEYPDLTGDSAHYWASWLREVNDGL